MQRASAGLLLLLASCVSTRDAAPLPTPAEVVATLAPRALEVPPLGALTRTVSGASPEAQAWFDQGLRYLWGFNQDQAGACFARAAQASPECAMAWWGIAHVFSVDVNNDSVSPEEAAWAHVAAVEATRLAPGATALEQALVAAAATRTPASIPVDRDPLDEAYAEAMGAAAATFPDDAGVQALHAESLMLLQPWEYWTWDGAPLGRAREIEELLEAAIALDPEHPGAHHLYIHIVEASSDPYQGVASADALGRLMPGSGHLIHMPSHIYANVGRYEDAVEVNVEASALDAAYFEAYAQPSFYLNYYVHNLHFVAYAAMMDGRAALAMEYVQRMEDALPEELHRAFAPFIDGHFAIRTHALMRFGRWEELLAEAEPAEWRHSSRAFRLYGRAVALANLGRTGEARAELAAFDAARAEVPEGWKISFNPADVVLGLAREVAEAEIRWREGDAAGALEQLEAATLVERELVYTEPPAWSLPVRHVIGAIQVATGDGAAAESTYRRDLAKLPGNGWSLVGLQQALSLQGREGEAQDLQPAIDRAWARADEQAPASCYCGVAVSQ